MTSRREQLRQSLVVLDEFLVRHGFFSMKTRLKIVKFHFFLGLLLGVVYHLLGWYK